MRARYDRITTTIEREWLAEIIAGTKKIEYCQIKPYWDWSPTNSSTASFFLSSSSIS
jgi:hypothetical protein